MQGLKEIRVSKDMTIREVGDRAGISESFYCMIENGERRPSVETAKKIASVTVNGEPYGLVDADGETITFTAPVGTLEVEVKY